MPRKIGLERRGDIQYPRGWHSDRSGSPSESSPISSYWTGIAERELRNYGEAEKKKKKTIPLRLARVHRQTDRQTRALPLLCRRVLRVSRFLCTATTQPPVHTTTLDASLAVPLCHLGNKAPLLQTSQPRWQICLHQESRSHVHTYVITSVKILLRQKKFRSPNPAIPLAWNFLKN